MSTGINITAEELRVLACLIEKSHTTPDQYPLSSNALVNACNQKSSRDPVVDYSTQQVDETLQLLRDAGWVRMIRAKGNRAFKHRHVIDEKLELSTPQQAVIAVLALRGPQSPGELKTRTDRYHPFADLSEVEQVLVTLRDREVPLTRNVGRASGQSQDRWIQLIGPHDTTAPVPAASNSAGSSSAAPVASAVGQNLSSPMSVGQEVRSPLIDCIPAVDWSDDLLKRVNDSGLDAVQASVPSGESFRDFVRAVEGWNVRFLDNVSHAERGGSADDVRRAMVDGRTAVVLASPGPSPIEDDIGLIEVCHMLGLRFMALSDGDPSPLVASPDDGELPGGGALSAFGRAAIAEMNRVGMVVELGRCGDRLALEAIETSTRPAVISACKPSWGTGSGGETSDEVLDALTKAEGLVGLVLEPQAAAIETAGVESGDAADFGLLVAEAADRYGADRIAIGSGSSGILPGAPGASIDGRQGMDAVVDALSGLGFVDSEVEAVTGGNWLRFFEASFGPE